MKKTIYLSLLIGIFLGGFAFISDLNLANSQMITPTMSSESKIKIVASISIIEDIVNNLINNTDTFEVLSLISGTEDPHTYEPKSSDIDALVKADYLLLFNHPDLESWWVPAEDNPTEIPSLRQSVLQTRGSDLIKVIEVANESMLIEDPFIGEKNSHMWMNPYNVKGMVFTLWSILRMNITDSAKLAIFDQNYLNYQGQLDGLISLIDSKYSQFSGMKVVETHPAFFYLTELLNITRVDVVEKKHDIEPSAIDIQNVINNMTENGCKLILHQADIEPKQANSIARNSQINGTIILGIPLLGMTGYDGKVIATYLDMIKYNINALEHPLTPNEVDVYWSSITGSSIDGYNSVIIMFISFVSIIGIILKRKII